jgi:hypothetical protein
MRMTIAKLTKLGACSEGIQYFKDNKFKTVEQAISSILKTDHKEKCNWSNWLITRVMNKKNHTRYAIYAAEQVIHIFEEKYPEDKKPREAIRAAKVYLKNPSEGNKKKCRIAARAVANTADALNAVNTSEAVIAFEASEAAASYAADAAWAASVDAADQAASNAVWATYYAVWATYYAAFEADANTSKNEMTEKIIRYGLKLLN